MNEKKDALCTEHRTDVSPAVQAIMSGDLSVDQMREVIALQREWEANEARKAYTAALVAVKKELPAVIRRDTLVSYGSTRYTHASLAAAVDAVTPVLAQHGFSVSFPVSTDGRMVTVGCRITHSMGHSEEAVITSPSDDGKGRSASQNIASTITMLSRYTLLSLLGIATADMRDPQPGAPRDESPNAVDPERNRAAVRAIQARGYTVEDVRGVTGDRTPLDWTAADLDALRAWLATAKGEEDAP
jgi:hypothetical protein